MELKSQTKENIRLYCTFSCLFFWGWETRYCFSFSTENKKKATVLFSHFCIVYGAGSACHNEIIFLLLIAAKQKSQLIQFQN